MSEYVVTTSTRIGMARIALAAASIRYCATKVLVGPAGRTLVLPKAGRFAIPNPDCSVTARCDSPGVVIGSMVKA